MLTKQSLSITLIDVGGQRSERKKWLHCFDDVNAVLFIAAMSDYDQTLREDGQTNRMNESLRLFGTVSNSKWFENSSMMLFLNKKDVFDQKIQYSPLTTCFPEYHNKEEQHSPESFLSEQFVQQVNVDRGIYRHFTCAKDRQNISVVFEVTIDLIKQKNMQYCGMC